MSLRKCEKLIAPRTLKRVCAVSMPAPEGAVRLSCMMCLLASSSSVLRECVDEAFRAIRLSERVHLALGRARLHRRDRPDRLPGRGCTGLVRAADPARGLAPVAGSRAFAGICRAHHIAHARGALPVAGLYSDIRNLGRQERACRQAAGAHSRHFAVRTHPGFHIDYKRLLPVAGARARARSGICGDLRHIHQSSLEYGVQLLSIAAHGADANSSRRPNPSGCRLGCGSGSWRFRSACRHWCGT